MNDPNTVQSLEDETLEAVSAGTFIGLDAQPCDGTVTYDFKVGDIVDVKSGFPLFAAALPSLAQRTILSKIPAVYPGRLLLGPIIAKRWKAICSFPMAGETGIRL